MRPAEIGWSNGSGIDELGDIERELLDGLVQQVPRPEVVIGVGGERRPTAPLNGDGASR